MFPASTELNLKRHKHYHGLTSTDLHSYQKGMMVKLLRLSQDKKCVCYLLVLYYWYYHTILYNSGNKNSLIHKFVALIRRFSYCTEVS